MGLRLILTIVSPILHDFFTGVLHLILQFKKISIIHEKSLTNDKIVL